MLKINYKPITVFLIHCDYNFKKIYINIFIAQTILCYYNIFLKPELYYYFYIIFLPISSITLILLPYFFS